MSKRYILIIRRGSKDVLADDRNNPRYDPPKKDDIVLEFDKQLEMVGKARELLHQGMAICTRGDSKQLRQFKASL